MSRTSITQTIQTNGSPFIYKLTGLSLEKLEMAKREFSILLDLKIVRRVIKSTSFSSPYGQKTYVSCRPSGEYRRINFVTIPDRYPLPNFQHLHHILSEAVVFLKSYLVKAYHFFLVVNSDIKKTVICTQLG